MVYEDPLKSFQKTPLEEQYRKEMEARKLAQTKVTMILILVVFLGIAAFYVLFKFFTTPFESAPVTPLEYDNGVNVVE